MCLRAVIFTESKAGTYSPLDHVLPAPVDLLLGNGGVFMPRVPLGVGVLAGNFKGHWLESGAWIGLERTAG